MGKLPRGMTLQEQGDLRVIHARRPWNAGIWLFFPVIATILIGTWNLVSDQLAQGGIVVGTVMTLVVLAMASAQLNLVFTRWWLSVSDSSVTYRRRSWFGNVSEQCALRDFRVGNVHVYTGRDQGYPPHLEIYFGNTQIAAFTGWRAEELEEVAEVIKSWTQNKAPQRGEAHTA